jgi:hypothetical protein
MSHKKKLTFSTPVDDEILGRYASFKIADLEAVAAKFVGDVGVDADSVYFTLDVTTGYYDSIVMEAAIHGERLETDAERDERDREAEAARVAARERAEREAVAAIEKDRATLARLLEKYGPPK